MAKFRKLPVEIEAEQFLGVSVGQVQPAGVCFCDEVDDGGGSPHAHVHTAHEGQTVKLSVGDWVVPESQAPGRYYPIKPDVMAASYEPVK